MHALPRGRHGLAREFIAQNQRQRLTEAAIQCVYEVGYPKTTVAHVAKRAAVSKSDFYKRFEDKDACFAAAYDEAARQLRGQVLGACEIEQDWPLRVRDAIAALLDSLAGEPARARLLLVEGLRAGRGIYDRFQDSLQGFAVCLRSGAPSSPAASGAQQAMDEAVVGGIAALLSRRIGAGDGEGLTALLPDLTEFALRPYVGAAEAGRISSQR
jgi:AcrR family transcriptional regulator